MSDPVFFLSLASIICGSTVLVSAIRLVRQHIESKARQAPAALPPTVDRRLERMEQTLDAMAIEIERVAEANRFMSKLLAERPTAAIAPTADTARADPQPWAR